MGYKKGDEIIVISTEYNYFFSIGDRATLTKCDSDGDWWASFDGEDELCLQEGITEYKLA